MKIKILIFIYTLVEKLHSSVLEDFLCRFWN